MKLLLLLRDFKYFILIMLLFLAIVMAWLPLKFLSFFFKDKPARLFVALFEKFD